jgi:hypothetical protein
MRQTNPSLARLGAGDHGCKLGTDDGLRVERLAKCNALVCPPEASDHRQLAKEEENAGTNLRHSSTTFRCAETLCATIIHRSWFYLSLALQKYKGKGRGTYEVGKDNGHALANLAEGVGDRNTNVVKCHESGPCGRGVGSLDGLGGDIVVPRDEDCCVATLYNSRQSTRAFNEMESKRETNLSPAAGGKVVSKGPVCNPLLGAIDHPLVAIPYCCGLQPCDVAPWNIDQSQY